MAARRLVPLLVAVLLVGVLLLAIGRDPPAPSAQTPDESVLLAMQAILEREGLAAALDSLAGRAKEDTALEREGHQMAHALGRLAVMRGGGGGATIHECRPDFASGCYHGVVEAALQAAGQIDMPALERLCRSAEAPASPAPAFECIHGLGHGVLGARRYDLGATLRDCDALSTPRLASSCHAGAFMEAINAALGASPMSAAHDHGAHAGHGAQALMIDAADPYSPCRRYEDPYASSCWLFQGFLILRASGFDPARALAMCDRAPGGRAPRCYESVGHQLTGLLQKGDGWILEQCGRGRPLLAAHCAGGATLALNAMDWTGTRAARLCAAAPEPWKDTCYRMAAASLVDLAPASNRERMCQAVEPEYAPGCREAGDLVAAPAAG